MLDDRGAVGVAHVGGDDVIGVVIAQVVVVVIAHEITEKKVKVCMLVCESLTNMIG